MIDSPGTSVELAIGLSIDLLLSNWWVKGTPRGKWSIEDTEKRSFVFKVMIVHSHCTIGSTVRLTNTGFGSEAECGISSSCVDRLRPITFSSKDRTKAARHRNPNSESAPSCDLLHFFNLFQENVCILERAEPVGIVVPDCFGYLKSADTN